MKSKSLLLFVTISIVSLVILVACGTAGITNQDSQLIAQSTQHCADVSGDYTGIKVEDSNGVTVTTISVKDTNTGEYIDVTVTIDGITVTLEPVNTSLSLVDANWCIKAANLASNGTGSEAISTPHTKTNKKGKANTPDVSYFMLYSVSTQEPVPTLVASNDSFTVSESEMAGDVDVNILSNDSGSNLIVIDVTALSPDLGSFTFTPDGDIDFDAEGEFEDLSPGEELVLSFTYTVSDGTDQTTATVEITVVGENDAPEAMDDAFSTDADTVVALPILANDSDIDGDALSITAVTTLTPDKGTLILNADGSYSYDPMGAFADLLIGEAEQVMFTYTVSDGIVSVDADVIITITGTKENLCVDNLSAIMRSYDLETQDDVVSMRADFMDANGNLTHNILDGNLFLKPASGNLDLSPLDFLAEITGGFILDRAFNVVTLDGSGLECLSEIGSFRVEDNPLLESISGFPALTTVGGRFDIDDNDSLTSISGFPLLDTVGGAFVIQNNAILPSISGFPLLDTVGGFIITLNPSLQSISGFPMLSTVNERFISQQNNALTSISGFNALKMVVGSFIIDSHDALQSISDFSMLETVGDKFLIGSNDVLPNLPAFPALTGVGGDFSIEFNNLLTSISRFTALEIVGGFFEIRGNSNLTSISGFSALETVGTVNQSYFTIQNHNQLTSISEFTSLREVGDDFRIVTTDMLTNISEFTLLKDVAGNFEIGGHDVLTTIPDFPALETIGGDFRVISNPNLAGTTAFPVLNPISGNVTINTPSSWVTSPDPLPTTP